MIDAKTLAYDLDEEAQPFAEPPAQPVPGPSWPEKAALAAAALGLLALALLSAGGPLAGTWLGLGGSLGLLCGGTATWLWLALAGTEPGIRHDGLWFRSLLSRGALAWLAGIFMTGFYVIVYFRPAWLGERAGAPPTGLVRVVDPLAELVTGSHASRWFLYGVLYTLAILVFGVRMLLKYRHSRYHKIRTASVMLFQALFAWLLPNLLVLFQKPYMELNGIWPLKYDYLMPHKVLELRHEPGAVGTFLLFWALVLALVATPVLTYYYGKRWYCSWVCGCGGLAETLGDPFRQLSDKSARAWKVERWLIHSVLVLVVAATAAVWIDHGTDGRVLGSFAGRFKEWYGFWIGAIFSGVVGVGFYPLLGSRVWCRFGCPQAAILGLLQRCFSRFRITTNGGQCMSCGNCSTYCEMGIDVRAYAQKGENVVRASCVGCGVCASVCPRGVLKLENGSTHGDRFAGAESPLGTFLDSLRKAGYPR